MEAFYWKAPTAAQLEAWGKLKASDFPEPVVEVWEENWDVMLLFTTYQNSWRMGPMGPVGLDYTVFHHALDRKNVKGDEFDEFIHDLQVIEQTALKELAKATPP